MFDTLEIAVARQPIFDRSDRLVAYELLYRNRGTDLSAGGVGRESAQMSSDTITRSLLGFGLERVTCGKRAFVNVDRAMLLDGSTYVLDPETVVLELLENTPCDDEVIRACCALTEYGYTLALDDFVYDPVYNPLLRLSQIVKFDVLGQSPDALRRQLELVRPFGVSCLAERVETAAMRDECAALGFDLYQGYFFARPETIGGRDIPLAQANIIRLLNLLRDANCTDAELEEVFKADLSLTYRLLRIVNSAGTGSSGVTSIGHGIRLLGRSMLHRWMALLLVSSLSSGVQGTRDELVELAMVRARFSELLMESLGRRSECAPCFVTGLFSLLDALLEVPMLELVERVNLTSELKAALLSREGRFGTALRIAEAYEGARWAEVFSQAEALHALPENLPELYLRAVEWARTTLSQRD